MGEQLGLEAQFDLRNIPEVLPICAILTVTNCQKWVSNHAYRGFCDLNDLMVILIAIVFFLFLLGLDKVSYL